MSFPISITWSGGAPPVGGFQQMAQAASQLDKALSTSAGNFDKFASSVGRIEGPIGGVASGMEGLSGSLGGVESSIGGAASGMESFAGSTETLNGTISETGGFVTEATGSITEFGGAATEGATGATELGTASTEANTGVTELGTSAATTVPTFVDMATGATDSGTAVTELGTSATDTNTVLGESVTALGDVVPGLQDTATGAADSAQGFSDLAPPIESTNEALDSSSGLLEGVSPLLGSTGENAGTAAATTEDFSGALGSLNTELPGVNGGLTTGNTLVNDFGTEAGTTQGKTDDLKGSMASLAFGLTTLVSAGLGLVGAFTSIRDAGFKVEAANIRAEKATTALDKAMLSAGKAIQKLATDSEAPIQGMGRLQTAFANFQKLIDAGITRGPQYTAALNELKAAGDALHGSTIKDNNAIAALNISLDGLGQKASKADLENRKLTKSLEAQAESYVQAGLTLASFAGGIGSTIQTITTMGSALAIMKGAFVDLGIVLSQSVIPALGAIAVPVGIAVAAIVGFVAAVTAIRANLKVFDDMGVAIGKVFPAMVPMLDAARQAFINFSDAINSSVSVILGGIDALTGGTLKLKEHWDGFTETLPKGTANVNVLDQSLFALAKATGAAGETAKLTSGQFKIVGDSLVRLSDGAKIGRTHWQQLDATTVEYSKNAAKVPPAVQAQTDSLTAATTAQDAMGAATGATGVVLKEQTSNYSELSNAQKLSVEAMNNVTERLTEEKEKRALAIAEAQKYLMVIEGITPAAGLSGAAIVGMSAALSGETQAHFEAVAAAAEYIQKKDDQFLTVTRTDAEILKYAATLKEEEKASGKATEETSKHEEALKKLQETLADTSAELLFYSDSANTAVRMQLEFNTGVADAQKKIQDETFALAKMAGELSVWNDEQQRATAIGNAFVRGLLEQVKATQKVATDTANAKGAVMGLRIELGSAEGAVNRFNKGMEEGRKSALEFLAGLAEAKGEAVGFREELIKAASGITGAMVDMSQKSTEEIQQLIEVAAGIPGAFEQVANELEGMADQIISTLADAAKEGGDAFMKEIEALEEQLGQKFSEPMIQELELQANIKNAENDIKTALGVFASMLQNKPLEVALKTQAAQDAMHMLMTTVDQAAAMSPKFQPLQTALQNLAAWKPADGLAKLPLLLTNVVQEASKMEGGMQGAIQAFDGMFNAAASTTAGLESLKSMFAAVGFEFDTQTGVIKDGTGQIVGDLQTMSEKAGGSVTATTVAIDTLGPAGTRARTTLAYEMVALTFLIDKFAQETKQSAIEVSTAFANMSANTHTSMNTMASGFIIVITATGRLASESQRMASTVSGSFSNMANNTRASMSTMASGFIIILTAFTRAGSESQRMSTTVSASMRSAASSASTFASGMTSSMSKASSAMQTATSRAKALQSAINALKSKTITITTVYVTIRRTIMAAKGGAFVTSNPTNVGPVKTSEFGQAELVTVTPLQTPGRQTVPGLSSLLKGEQEKKGKRMMAREAEGEGKGKQKEVVMMRETPIIVQVDGREIARVVNKRIFEESDALV